MAHGRVVQRLNNEQGIFVFLDFENKFDKGEFVLNFIEPLTVSNLFPLEVVRKCQHSSFSRMILLYQLS